MPAKTYRVQLIELPAEPGKHRLFGAGYSTIKMLLNLEVSEAQVLPLLAVAVALLQQGEAKQEG